MPPDSRGLLIRMRQRIGRLSLLAGLARTGRGPSASPETIRLDSLKQRIAEAHREWVAVRGDKTLRLEYHLDRTSAVLDVGGFEGQWASDIFGMYQCEVHVFEPVEAHYNAIRRRFRGNDRIHVYPFGLGGSSRKETITVAGDASSVFSGRDGEVQSIDIVEAAEYLDEQFPGTIDLMKINIEGAEYELLEHLIARGTVMRIKNIQVQFHDFVADAAERMHNVQSALQLSHALTYQYPFIWENWTLQGSRNAKPSTAESRAR